MREPSRRRSCLGRRRRLFVLAGRHGPPRGQPVDLASRPAHGPDAALVARPRRRSAGDSPRRRRGAGARRRVLLLRLRRRAARSDFARGRRSAAFPPQRRQMRSTRAVLCRRHGRQRGTEDLQPLAARRRSVGDAGRRRHHLHEWPLLESRQSNVLSGRHVSGRILGLRLRHRHRIVDEQTAVPLLQERPRRRGRLDDRRRGVRLERAADFRRSRSLCARRDRRPPHRHARAQHHERHVRGRPARRAVRDVDGARQAPRGARSVCAGK